MVACSDAQLINHNALISNGKGCFNPELDVNGVLREQTRWDGKDNLMLLVQFLSIAQIETLQSCVTVPGDTILIAIKGDTHTCGVHLTKVNLSSTHNHQHLVIGVPVINLVYVELHSKQVCIQGTISTTGWYQQGNRHLVAATSQKTQKVVVVVHIIGRITARANHRIVLFKEIIIKLTFIAWTGGAWGN